MTTRRTVLGCAALLASASTLKSALGTELRAPAKQADFLFVQTANSMSFDKSQQHIDAAECGNTYYRTAFQGNNLVYVVAQP